MENTTYYIAGSLAPPNNVYLGHMSSILQHIKAVTLPLTRPEGAVGNSRAQSIQTLHRKALPKCNLNPGPSVNSKYKVNYEKYFN